MVHTNGQLGTVKTFDVATLNGTGEEKTARFNYAANKPAKMEQ